MKTVLYLATALAALASPTLAQTYDIVISGGRVMDPASGRDEVANVGISGNRIAEISTAALKGKRNIDARGLVVAPGFVDLHAHGQHDKGQQFQVLDGVTTAIDAEGGAMPVQAFVGALKGRALINFGATASHQCARMEVIAGAPCKGHGAANGETVADRKAYTASATPEQQKAIVAALDQRSRQARSATGSASNTRRGRDAAKSTTSSRPRRRRARRFSCTSAAGHLILRPAYRSRWRRR
ncbi:hypothetical protein GGQ98_001673 [Sphingosinicella soli]|uniref:Amidohydrolase 3 domain-containing protein n=1 Tax=Sphingosinicella soli TaxID=333708 RepID=A0A7W7B128_9SPHN|nr:hypothetical protein [Sphingosinicella soli]